MSPERGQSGLVCCGARPSLLETLPCALVGRWICCRSVAGLQKVAGLLLLPCRGRNALLVLVCGCGCWTCCCCGRRSEEVLGHGCAAAGVASSAGLGHQGRVEALVMLPARRGGLFLWLQQGKEAATGWAE